MQAELERDIQHAGGNNPKGRMYAPTSHNRCTKNPNRINRLGGFWFTISEMQSTRDTNDEDDWDEDDDEDFDDDEDDEPVSPQTSFAFQTFQHKDGTWRIAVQVHAVNERGESATIMTTLDSLLAETILQNLKDAIDTLNKQQGP
jgi:hypothetical protein